MLAIVDKPMQQTYTQVALRAQVSWSPVKRLSLGRLVQTAMSRAVEVVSQKEVTITRQVEVTVPVVTDVVATRSVVQVVTKPVEVTKQVEVPTVSFTAVNVSTNVTKTKEVPITQTITKTESVQVMEAITEVINITTYACSACASRAARRHCAAAGKAFRLWTHSAQVFEVGAAGRCVHSAGRLGLDVVRPCLVQVLDGELGPREASRDCDRPVDGEELDEPYGGNGAVQRAKRLVRP
jgi:hypothetical protein